MAADILQFLSGLVSQYGLIGLFFASIIANATVFLPLPIDLVVLAIGSGSDIFGLGVFGPPVIGIVVGIGAGIGELVGYFFGFAGRKGIETLRKVHFEKIDIIREKIENRGMLFIILATLTPFPFDIVGIIAGLSRYNVFKFFAAACIGKSIKFTLIASAGLLGMALIKFIFGIP